MGRIEEEEGKDPKESVDLCAMAAFNLPKNFCSSIPNTDPKLIEFSGMSPPALAGEIESSVDVATELLSVDAL